MPNFFGTAATSAIGNVINIPYSVKSFSLVNKTGGAVTVSAGIILGSSIIYWVYNKSLAAGENYLWGDGILVESGYAIFVSASGNCDYYFSIE